MFDFALELAFVEIDTTRLGAWKSLAEEVLGLATESVDADGRAALLLRADRARYRVVVREADVDRIVRIVYRVGDQAELDRLTRRFEELSIPHGRGSGWPLPTGRPSEAYVDVTDPAGNDLRFTWAVPEESDSALPSSGITYSDHRLGALGHVVLIVPDLVESVTFYTEVLGFRISDYIGDGPGRLAFLRCNERHHTVAFQAGSTPRVDHLMLEVDDIDDLGCVYDKARALPATVLSEPGRHTNDLAISFYLKTPLEGLEIEFATGGIDVTEPWSVNWHEGGSIWGHKRP
ncbi:VOC family protein [Dactylosporangium roseum]